MFMGEYNHTIDAKGRIIVPAKFREALGDEFVVTKGLDGCLFVYSQESWKAFEEKLQSLPLTNKNSRQFARFFLAGAALCEVDKQGRILLPQLLRDFAGLEKEAVLVGVANRVEIWSKDRWHECIEDYDSDMDEVAENMESLGFSI
jgi:MraZ protein